MSKKAKKGGLYGSSGVGPLETPPSNKKAKVVCSPGSSSVGLFETPTSSTREDMVCLSTGSPVRPTTRPKPLLQPTEKRSCATDFTAAFQESLRFRPLLHVIITNNIFRSLIFIQLIKYF